MATGPWLDQSSQQLNLRWDQGDPVSFVVAISGGAGWVGTYDVESTDAHIAAMTGTVVAGTWDESSGVFTAGAGADAQLSLTLSAAESVSVPTGVFPWALKQVGGAHRLRGRVEVV